MSSELDLNRLNFPNMVDRHIKGISIPFETNNSPLVIMGQSKALENKHSTRAKVSTSLNSVEGIVPNKLKNPKVELHKISEEASKLADELTLESSSKNISELKSEMIKTKTDFKGKTLALKGTSIPQIKATRAYKQHQRMRRNILKVTDYNDPISQKRIIEVREQKRILEDMLMQHHRLQRDRQSIAMEIQAMREHLSDIRNKLDISLRRLTAKPIVNSQALLRQKVYLRPQKFNLTHVQKSYNPSTKVPLPHSILKKSINSTSKSTNVPVKSANSLVRDKQSLAHNSHGPSRNTKR